MPITSRSEFEAILSQACIRIDRAMTERGQVPSLEDARRTLELVANNSKNGPRLKELRPLLERASDALSADLDDSKVREDLWDCLDYIDYRA